jgi:ATP/maltotriose-dependent transcriptional regulator MalT
VRTSSENPYPSSDSTLLRFRQVAQLITSTTRLIGIAYRASMDEWAVRIVSANPYVSEPDFSIHRGQGEFPAAFAIAPSMPLTPHADDTCEISEQCRDAMLEFRKLRPVLAGRLAEHALQTARAQLGSDSSATHLPAVLLAESLYEQGRLEEADSLLRFRMPAIRSSGSLECAARAYVVLVRVSMHSGRRDFALSLLRDARALGERLHWPSLVAISTAECSWLFLEEGDGGAAENSLRDLVALVRHSPAAPPAMQHALRMQRVLLECQLASTRGSCNEAVARLTQLCEDEPPGNFDARWTLQLQLQLAASQARSERRAAARETLSKALQTGAGNGLCMSFIDAGRLVRELIAGLCREPVAADAQLVDLLPYARSLLRHFDGTAVPNGSKRLSSEVNQSLTQRESGVLQLIAHGLSNKRIAQRLDITPETVKSHAKNIFFKLAAQTRAQAVARAEALGII